MTEPISVLHLLWSGGVGGAPRAIYQLVRAQLEKEQSVAVAFANPGGEYYERIKELGCRIHDLGLTKDSRLWKATSVHRVIDRYSLHHFHGPEITIGLASILSGHTTRVYTRRTARTTYAGWQRSRYRLFASYVRRRFHGVSGNSLHAISAGEELFGIDKARWRLTYNGLYFDELEPRSDPNIVSAELNIDRDTTWVIATSGSLRAVKRFDRLLAAVAQLGSGDHRLLVIGDGPLRGEIELQAERLGIANQTRITGMKPSIGDYLQLANVFVLPSGPAESFGNAAVEAMALGIPTIVFEDGGGATEHIRHFETGLIVGGVDDLANTLRELQKNQALQKRLGGASRTFVRTQYTPSRMVAAYDQLYSDAIANSTIA